MTTAAAVAPFRRPGLLAFLAADQQTATGQPTPLLAPPERVPLNRAQRRARARKGKR